MALFPKERLEAGSFLQKGNEIMEFVVLGAPQGKARPRFSRKSGTVYTPKKTANYEKKIAAEYRRNGGPMFPAGTYVSVHVKAIFPIPQSWSKAKKQEAIDDLLRPDKKPDIDNILKVVLDALNGVAYEDDKQVVCISCQKIYGYLMGMVQIAINEVKV